jgi:hypothetical protein
MSEEPKTASEIASLGGKASAAKLTKTQRAERAAQAAAARWGADLPVATHGSQDRPLTIGNLKIQAYVLEDGTRVLTQGDFQEALGRHRKANVRYEEGEEQVPPILQGERIKPFISSELLEKSVPIKFRTTEGNIASGYRAEILPAVCEVFLKAADAKVLQKQQEHIAVRANILIRGLATVGIIALVDEATGYQDARARDALAKILEAFVAKELQKWVSTFPIDYFKEMCRLRGIQFSPNLKSPRYFGHLTNDIVYARLAPGVLDELRRKNPTVGESKQRKSKHFQWLTSDHGHPRLRIHLEGLIVAMKLSKDWKEFHRRVNDLYPRMNETPTIPGMRYDDPDGDEVATDLPSSSTALLPPSSQSPPAAQG